MARRQPKPTIPRRTEPTRVASPTVPGAVEFVERAQDTLTSLARRRQIPERLYQAGERYRMAHDALIRAVGGVMDFERVRGGGGPQAPSSGALIASETLSLARRILYPSDYATVHRVCALGWTLEDCSGLFGSGRPAREEAGRALRAGLRELADRWFPLGSVVRIRAILVERPDVTDVGTVNRSVVYHARS